MSPFIRLICATGIIGCGIFLILLGAGMDDSAVTFGGCCVVLLGFILVYWLSLQ